MEPQQTLRELVVEIPAAARIFEKLGLDYCCGGGQTLEQACRAGGLVPAQVMASLQTAEEARVPREVNWQVQPLSNLIAHIQDRHHIYTRGAIERLAPLFAKVSGVHGANHTELRHESAIFDGLAQELTMHMMKEEMVLFPYIVRLEEAVLEKQPAIPPPFGTVQNPIAMMVREHDSAGDALRALRRFSNGNTAPADGCASYRELYRALLELEADLHQHIHLENNILFPRAVALESSLTV